MFIDFSHVFHFIFAFHRIACVSMYCMAAHLELRFVISVVRRFPAVGRLLVVIMQGCHLFACDKSGNNCL